MFDAIRNWFEVRSAMKDERRLRSGRAVLNTIVLEDRLRHVEEMLRIGQVAYATATMDELLARYPDEAAELPLTVDILTHLKRLDEAEALAVRGMQRNPDNRDFVRLYNHVADHRGDIPERLRRWRSFRRRYPALGMSFRMEANALLAAGEDAAAERLLAEGARVVTDDVGLAIEYARRAEARRDWPEALRRWAVVRDAFAHPIGVSKVADTLVEQGLHDQAEAELLAARPRFPLEARIIEDLAALAERRGDLDAALAYWAEVRRDLPHITGGYTEAVRLLRQRGDQKAADAMIAEGAARAPDHRGLQFDHAALAERDGDWAEAARRWQRARQRFESDPIPYGREAAALRALGQLDQAEEVLLAANQRFPDMVDLQRQLAELAEARGKLDLAVHHWRAVVAAQPEVWWTHSSLARVLARGGDGAGADDTLAAAIARLPDEPMLYAEHAAIAAQDGRADEAAARWAAARQRFGLHPVIAGGEAGWLRGQGRLAEAKAILGAASQQAPDNAGLLHDLGHLAAQERDWPEAERCWRTALALQPQAGWAYGELARALREQGRATEAGDVLATAWERHPGDFGIGAAWAREASEAKDWPEARRRWALLRERFPAEGHPVWQDGIALREMGLVEQARALWLDGADRFPADASFPHDLARLAEARGDHAEAELYWRRYTALQPGVWWAWVGIASAVQAQGRIEDAESVLLEADEACPTIPAFLQLRADWARQRQDWPEAERQASLLVARFPDAWESIWTQVVIARDQGRTEEMRALLLQGAERHPGVGHFAHDLARLAEREHDWPQAEGWWRAFTDAQTDMAWAYTGLARALREQQRVAEADAVLEQVLPAFTGDLPFHIEYASNAVATGQHEAAAARFALSRKRFGLAPPLAVAQARWLQDRERPDEAAALLAEAIACHPEAPELAREQREVQATLDALNSDPPVQDLDLLIGPASTPRPLQRSLTYTWYINGWMLPCRLDRNHGTSFLTMACPDDFFAVRVGFANVLSTPWTIGRAILCASAAFGDHINPTDADGRMRPDAAWRPLTFAGGGQDRPDIVADPAAPSRIVVAGSGVPTADPHGGEPVWTWTDWVPCRSLAPDPETGMRVLMLRAYAPGGEMITYPNGAFDDYRLDRSANSGFEYACFGCGEDRFTRPSLTQSDGWTVPDLFPRQLINGSMFHAVQLLTRHSVVQGMATGDSHHAGRFLRTAVTRLGAQNVGTVPFACANTAVGGLPSAQFFPRLDALLPAVDPSYVVLPGWTHNDYPQPNPDPAAIDRRYFEHLCEVAAGIRARGAVAIWLTPFPRDPAHMTPPVVASWHWLRDAILAQRAGGEIVVDAALLLGCSVGGRLTGSYRPEYTTDRMHPNEAGHDALGDLLQAAVQRHFVIGPPAENRLAAPLAASTQEPDPPPPEHPQDFTAACAWAREAAEAGDWPEARRRWGLLGDQFPAESHPLWQEGIALREAGHAAAARALFLTGTERYPADFSFPLDLARLAEAEHDWPAAERWWHRCIALQPDLWWVHTALAKALQKQRRLPEAEAVLLTAQEAMPGDHALLLAHARLAEGIDWPEAEHRFARLAERFPTVLEGLLGQATAARQQGRIDEAEQLLQLGAERHPQAAVFLQDLARLAEQRQDWPAAAQAWRRFLAIDPQPWWAHNALARACLAQGARSDALAILRAYYTGSEAADPQGLAETIELLGASLEPALLPLIAYLESQLAPHVATAATAHVGLAYAHAARFLEKFDDYRTRAEALAARFPHEGFVREALHSACELAPRDEDLRAGSLNKALLGSAEDRSGDGDGFQDADWLRFESLGGGGTRGGCEFGLLQRRVGEPLSLLRWASIEPEQLAQALERRFEGLGNPATLSIETQGHYDWKAVETVYNIRMDHTHLDRQTVSRETAARQVLTRLKFLSRKLINDLGEGDKIFLYRFAGGVPDEATLQRISRAMASYGASRLLIVGEDAALRDGIDYRAPAPNLLLAVRPDTTSLHGLALDPRMPGWRQICEQGLRWQQGAFRPPARLPYPGHGNGAEPLADGADAISADFGIACLWARQAADAKDWTEARRRWALLRDRFPAEGHPWWQEAIALREAGQASEAHALLLAGAARFPRDSSFAHDLARLAEGCGDWPEAARWWQTFLGLQPDVWWAHTGLAQALAQQDRLDEAEAVLLAAQETLPSDHPIPVDYARVAERRGDWAEASRRWRAVRQRFPNDTTSIAREAAALGQLGLLDDAEALLVSGLQRFPAAADIHQSFAELAEARGDATLAAQRWRAAVAAEPGLWWPHAHLARALERVGDIAAAEAALAAAIARLPDEPILYIDHAELAGRDGRADEAAARWATARARFGPAPMLARREAEWLRDQGRLDEAKALLEAAHRQAPADVEVLTALGQIASRQGDFAAAETWWRAVLVRQPQSTAAHSALALALRRLDRADEADVLLGQAMAAYPGSFELAAAWARDAAERQDWPEARRRWAVVGERFPTEGHPWWQEGIALREDGRTEDARAHFLAGADRFPTDPSFPHDLGRLAEARGDHADAERCWRRYTELAPGDLWGWVSVINALRHQGRAADAESMSLGLEQTFPATPVFLRMRATWARQRRDWHEAERLAGLLQERFPAAWQGLHAQAMIAVDRDRLDEAQALLLRGAELHPNIVDFVVDLARVAERRQDLPDAERWWRRLISLQPDIGWAWAALADTLLQQDQPEAAEAILLKAADALPDEPAHLLRWAALAEPRGDWPEAERRYRLAQLRMPDNTQAPRGLAWAIHQQGRLSEAVEILQAANRRQPNATGHAQDLAQIAAQAGDLAEATRWWGAAAAAQPHAGWAQGALALTLELQGRAAEADDQLAAAIQAHPTSRALRHEYARAADRRGDRRLAIARWAAAADRFADDPVALHGHAVALAEAGEADAALRMLQDGAARFPGERSFERAAGQVAADLRDPAAVTRAAAIMPPVRLADDAQADLATIQRAVERFTGMPIRAFIMGFETLGNSCEFGFVQRMCGAEPLGLMRFAGMSAADMARGISTGFAGIGKHLSAHADETWDIAEQDYRIWYHTFRPLTESAETLLKTEPRRLRFLADKLLRDIDEADKTFLLWKTFIGISRSEAQPVIDAVHARNPRANVVFITPDSPFGYAEPLAPGVYRGHHRALAHAADQGVPDMQGWLEMLVNVWALNRRARR